MYSKQNDFDEIDNPFVLVLIPLPKHKFSSSNVIIVSTRNGEGAPVVSSWIRKVESKSSNSIGNPTISHPTRGVTPTGYKTLRGWIVFVSPLRKHRRPFNILVVSFHPSPRESPSSTLHPVFLALSRTKNFPRRIFRAKGCG